MVRACGSPRSRGGSARARRAAGGHRGAGLDGYPDSLFLFIGLSREGEDETTRLLRWRIRYPDRRALPQSFPGIFFPHLSPDGRWIAFAAPATPQGTQWHVWAA